MARNSSVRRQGRGVYRRPLPPPKRRKWIGTSGVIVPPIVVPDVPPQVPGGKGPLVRPAYDFLADLRTGGTGPSIRLIRDINESIERTTRQLVEAR